MALGLLMILAALIVGIRSQEDRVSASSQNKTSQSLSVAETGIARVTALLKKYPALVTKPTGDWNTTTDTTTTICSGGTASTASNETATEAALIDSIRSSGWIQVETGNPSKGEYKVLNYTLNSPVAGTNTLIVQARAQSDNGATTTSVLNSSTFLEVQIPTDGSTNIPGLWVRKVLSTPIDVSTDESLNTNVQVEGCSLPSDTSKIGTAKLETVSGTIEPIYDGSTPGVTADPDAFPSLPSPPTGTPVLPSIDASNCYVVLPRMPRTGSNPTGTTCNDKSSLISAFDGVTSDVPTDNVYRYIIDSTSSNSPGGDSIKLSNSQLIIDPPTGTKVVLYVRGNITISGTSPSSYSTSCVGTSTGVSSYINGGYPAGASYPANSGLPANLEIYGADGSGGGDWGTGYKMEKINVSDTTMMSAFIYAPEATVDVSQGQIKGTVWTKEFKASNSSGCDIAVIQQDVGNLQVQFVPTIDRVTLWRRREAP
jgi:hypothetical protein